VVRQLQSEDDLRNRESVALAPGSDQQQATVSRRRRRRHLYKVLGPLFILLILWVDLFAAEGAFKGGPNGKTFGADWAMFMGAAGMMRQGQNPYAHSALYRAEKQLLSRQRLPILKHQETVRVGNPPLFFWALEPLPSRPFQPVALAGILVLYLLSIAGFIAALYRFGWKRYTLAALCFILMPQVVLGMFDGNVIGLVFAGIGLSLALAPRYPALAGAVLSVAWLKPPVALPIVLLIAAFHVARPARLVAGFSLISASLFGLTLLTTGWSSVVNWIAGLVGYSQDMRTQPDVASLAGLYVRWMPSVGRSALEALSLGLAIAITAVYWYRVRRNAPLDFARDAWLWVVWMLATPYAHFYDEMILAIPIAALLGRHGHKLNRRLPVLALYLMFFSLLVLSWTPFQVYLLPLPLAGVAACMLMVEHHPKYSSSRFPELAPSTVASAT